MASDGDEDDEVSGWGLAGTSVRFLGDEVVFEDSGILFWAELIQPPLTGGIIPLAANRYSNAPIFDSTVVLNTRLAFT